MKKLHPKDIDESSIYYQFEKNGEEPTKWEQVTEINNKGYGIVLVQDYFGAVNSEGEIIIPLEYDNLIDFKELNSELILAKKKELWGYINWSNDVVIPFQYSYGSVFQDGEAKVCKDGKYWIINQQNQIIKEIDGLEKII